MKFYLIAIALIFSIATSHAVTKGFSYDDTTKNAGDSLNFASPKTLTASTATIPTLTAATALLTNATVSGNLTANIVSTGYILDTFDNADPTGDYLFASGDAKNFSRMQSGKSTSDSNFRDPRQILIGRTFYKSYTTSFPGSTNSLGLKKSTDLLNWSVVSTPNWSGLWTGTQSQVWNGCWYQEGSTTYLAFTLTGSSYQDQTPWITTFNPSNDSFGTPTQVTGTSLPGNFCFMHIWKTGSIYHALVQKLVGSGPNAYIEHWTSSALASGWSVSGANNWAGWGTSIEGGDMVVLPNGDYRVFFMPWGGGNLLYSDSSDFATWSAPATLITGFWDWVDVMPFTDLQTANVVLTNITSAIVTNDYTRDLNIKANITLSSSVPSRHTEPTYPALWLGGASGIVGDDVSNYEGVTLISNVVRQGSSWYLQDTTKPGWYIKTSYGEDTFSISRASATSSVAVFSNYLTTNSLGTQLLGQSSIGLRLSANNTFENGVYSSLSFSQESAIFGNEAANHTGLVLTANTYWNGTEWRCVNASYPSFQAVLSHGDDQFEVFRAPASAGSLSYTKIFSVSANGTTSVNYNAVASGTITLSGGTATITNPNILPGTKLRLDSNWDGTTASISTPCQGATTTGSAVIHAPNGGDNSVNWSIWQK